MILKFVSLFVVSEMTCPKVVEPLFPYYHYVIEANHFLFLQMKFNISKQLISTGTSSSNVVSRVLLIFEQVRSPSQPSPRSLEK